MRPKAYFIAPTVAQAAYWMHQWGYRMNEVKVLTPNTIFYGYRFSEPVYFCGSKHEMDEAYDRIMPCLELNEAQIIYAEDLR